MGKLIFVNISYEFYVFLKLIFSITFFLFISTFSRVFRFGFYSYVVAAVFLTIISFFLEKSVSVSVQQWHLIYEYAYHFAPLVAALVAGILQDRCKNWNC